MYFFFSLRDFGPILLPLQSAMRVTLPSTPGSHVDHNPFPTDPIFLQGFEDGVSTEPCPSLNQQVLINRCVSPNTHLNCGSLQNHLCHSTNRCLPTGVLFHQIHTWIVSLQNLLCCPTNRCLLFTDVSCLLIYPWLMFYFKMFSVAQSTGACQQVCCLNLIHTWIVSLQIEVLPSLQRPKKITMNGSDGKLYTMLCKPKVGKGQITQILGLLLLVLKIKTCTVWDWYIVS